MGKRGRRSKIGAPPYVTPFVSKEGAKKIDAAIMTVEEVAAYLRISAPTVYRLAQEHKIPGAKIGGQWRFRKEDVYNFLTRKIWQWAEQRDKEVQRGHKPHT